MILYIAYCLLLAFVGSVFGNKHNCPARTNVVSMQDIQFALKVSTLAYDESYKVGDKIHGTNYKVTFVHEDKYTNDTNDVGFRVFIVEHDKTTFVAYRGTDTTDQLLQQGISQLMRLKGVKYTINGEDTKVNQFFLNAFRLLQIRLKPRLQDPTRKYVLTGHSLGGAMASLLAIEMTQVHNGSIWKNMRSSLITFGQPRVGNQAYADLHDKLISPWRKLRFVLNRDPVNRIPFGPDFVHHSREIYLDHHSEWKFKWRFVPYLTYIKFWRVCDEQEDSKCSLQFGLAWHFSDHKLASYSDVIDQPPSRYETIKHDSKSHFTDAMIGSC